MGGGVYYNRKLYEELGLSVPKTWDEFMANKQPQALRRAWLERAQDLGRVHGEQCQGQGSRQGPGRHDLWRYLDYNRKLYEELGLSVPKTWDEFMANNAKVKEAGKVPVATTFGDTWTSQLFVLGDFYNVQAEVPTFAADYTANKAKYATTPAAARGFQYLEDVFKAGYMNEDFGVAKFEDGSTTWGTSPCPARPPTRTV